MRIALAIFFVLHGIAHGVGFVVPWKLMEGEEMTYSTTLLAGTVDVGDVGIRAVGGLLWLATGLAFVVTGAGTWVMKFWWVPAATTAAVASLVLSILGWPEARVGVVLNILVIGLLLEIRLGWWSF